MEGMREAGLNSNNVGDPRIAMEEEERKVGMEILFGFHSQFHQLFLHPNHSGNVLSPCHGSIEGEAIY